jgi:protein SCO1/2
MTGAALLFAAAVNAAGIDVTVDEKLGAIVPEDIVLRDEEGKPVTFGSLIDRPTILTLNYFRCAGICTPLLRGVQEAANAVPLEPEKDFRIVTVSFDPTDTFEVAAKKRENYIREMTRQFPPAAWRFLVGRDAGDAASTRRLAASVGFGYMAQGDQYIHPGVIIFLSPGRKVCRYIYGTSYLPAEVQMALLAAGRGEVVPTVANAPSAFSPSGPLRLLCYSRDPEGRGYVFDATKAAGSGIVLCAALFGGWLLLRGRPGGKKETPA